MKIIFFSPLSFFRQISFAEAALIKSLINNNFEVSRVTCNGLYNDLCQPMEASSLSIDSDQALKSKICKECISCSESIDTIKGLNTIKISKYITLKKLSDINHFIKNITLDNYEKRSVYNNIDFCKYALYLTILKFKLANKKITQKEHLNYYKNELSNCLRSYEVGKKIKDDINVDVLISYSIQYGFINSFLLGINKKNLRVYNLNGSNNNHYKHSLIRFWDWKKYGLLSPAKSNWDFYDVKKVSKDFSFVVDRHINELYKAKSPHVYSSQKKNRRYKPQEINKFNKVALLSMSSYDESLAAYSIGAFPEYKVKSKIFQSQLEWVDETIKLFRNYPEHALIVRIHPREIENKRDKVKSEHYSKILKYIAENNLPKNVFINYPNDKISFYDIINQVDFLISNISVTIIESIYHNRPVVVYDNKMSNYPDSILYVGNNREEYINNIIRLLNKSNSITRQNAIDWWSFKQGFGNLRLKNNFQFSRNVRALHKLFFLMGFSFPTNILKRIELGLCKLDLQSEQKLIECIKEGYTNLYDVRITQNLKYLKK